MRIDVFTLFPAWFEWFAGQRHIRNALALGHSLEFIDLRATTPLKAGQDDTPYGGGAGMVILEWMWWRRSRPATATRAPAAGGSWRSRRAAGRSTTPRRARRA